MTKSPESTANDCHADTTRRGSPHKFNGASKEFSVALLTVLALLTLLYLPISSAEHTRTWRQASYEDFLKGTAHGVAVRSDGRLELAPKFTQVAEADASYLWSLRVDPKGALYAAGGSPAKVFRFDHDQKPIAVFESTDLVAQAIAFEIGRAHV